MYLKGGHVADQQHYQLLCHQIHLRAHGLDRESLEKTLGYLRHHIIYSDVPNVVACLYAFTKSCLEVMPIWEAHPEWIGDPPAFQEFVPFTEEDHRRIVQKQLEADKRKQKRKKEVSLA